MKRIFKKFFFVLLIGNLLSGCAIGNKYNIANVKAECRETGKFTVVVASLDKRKFITDKTSPDTYVGMVRGGYGNPFDATTLSGLPFADAVSKAICNALTNKGFKAMPIFVKFDTPEKEVIKHLLDRKKDRAILVIIRQWESDSFYNLNVGYNFIMKVISQDGAILATAKTKNAINMPGSILTGALAMSKKEVPNIFKKAIESLLNNPEVMKALANSPGSDNAGSSGK